MERFWTLKYLQQNGVTELRASVFKEIMVRADDLPLVLPVAGARDLPRGAKVRVRLGDIDEITLDVGGTVVERLDAAVAGVATPQEPAYSAEEDEEEVAGPIAIAVDMADADAAAGDNPAS